MERKSSAAPCWALPSTQISGPSTSVSESRQPARDAVWTWAHLALQEKQGFHFSALPFTKASSMTAVLCSARVRSMLRLLRVFIPCALLHSSAEMRPRKGQLLAQCPLAYSRESQHPNADGLPSPAEHLILTWHNLLGPG